MSAVCADTFYWVALTNTRDNSHEKALRIKRGLAGLRIVTSEPVLIEYLNFFAEWHPILRRKATKNVADILARRGVEVLPLTREYFRLGFALYADRPDKGYSLTDCISMEMMRRQGLSDVFTNDRHFEQEGFRALFRGGDGGN